MTVSLCVCVSGGLDTTPCRRCHAGYVLLPKIKIEINDEKVFKFFLSFSVAI